MYNVICLNQRNNKTSCSYKQSINFIALKITDNMMQDKSKTVESQNLIFNVYIFNPNVQLYKLDTRQDFPPVLFSVYKSFKAFYLIKNANWNLGPTFYSQ